MLENALSIINESKILTEQDISSVVELSAELKNTFETVQIFRTRTEMEISVLNDAKHPTVDSKYWQAIREQNAMFNELVMLSYEYRKNAIEIMILERDKQKENDILEQELKQIEIEKKKFIALNMERTAHDRIREILEWSDIKKKLIPNIKFGTEKVNDHQLESFKIRFANNAKTVTPFTPPADAINLLGLFEAANKKNEKLIKEISHNDKIC